ncbi:hypothetical protein N9948_01255 [bacterium]|nr:hypothetical protein [bacterium]
MDKQKLIDKVKNRIAATLGPHMYGKVYVDDNTGELKRELKFEPSELPRGTFYERALIMSQKDVKRIADEMEKGKSTIQYKGRPVERDWKAIILKARKDEIV